MGTIAPDPAEQGLLSQPGKVKKGFLEKVMIIQGWCRGWGGAPGRRILLMKFPREHRRFSVHSLQGAKSGWSLGHKAREVGRWGRIRRGSWGGW